MIDIAFNYKLGTTIQDVLKYFKLPPERRNKLEDILLRMGYTNKGVAYAAVSAEEKLWKFREDSRFESIFINEVNKYALKPGDPRWKNKKIDSTIQN